MKITIILIYWHLFYPFSIKNLSNDYYVQVKDKKYLINSFENVILREH